MRVQPTRRSGLILRTMRWYNSEKNGLQLGSGRINYVKIARSAATELAHMGLSAYLCGSVRPAKRAHAPGLAQCARLLGRHEQAETNRCVAAPVPSGPSSNMSGGVIGIRIARS